MTRPQVKPETGPKPSRAQVRAARGIIERYEQGLGPKPSSAVIKIAAGARAAETIR